MKKIVLSLLVCVSMVAFAKVGTDAQIKKIEDNIAACKNDYFKNNMTIELEFLNADSPLANYAALKTAVTEKFTNYSFTTYTKDDAIFGVMYSLINFPTTAYHTDANVKSLYEDAIKLNKREVFFIVEFNYKSLGFTSEQVFNTAFTYGKAIETQRYMYAERVLNLMAKVADDLDDETVKAAYKKLNRAWTVNLTKDKENWEPIIVKLRLMIATY